MDTLFSWQSYLIISCYLLPGSFKHQRCQRQRHLGLDGEQQEGTTQSYRGQAGWEDPRKSLHRIQQSQHHSIETRRIVTMSKLDRYTSDYDMKGQKRGECDVWMSALWAIITSTLCFVWVPGVEVIFSCKTNDYDVKLIWTFRGWCIAYRNDLYLVLIYI